MRFKKYNNNPLGIKTGDCVVRAISMALDKSWDETYDTLSLLGKQFKVLPNDFKAFSIMLNGYLMKTPKAVKGKPRLKVEDLNKGTYVIRTANHMTFVKDGVNYDLWDNRKRSVYRYWIIEEVQDECRKLCRVQ